jgi:hypothetical protein
MEEENQGGGGGKSILPPDMVVSSSSSSLLTNLVHYASVAKGSMIIVAHEKSSSGTSDLTSIAVECLKNVPSFHSRFTYSTNQRILACLMEGAFTYSAIVDASLGKCRAFAFLEQVRVEFKTLLQRQGMQLDVEGPLDDDGSKCLNVHFSPILHSLVQPLVGVPWDDGQKVEEQDALVHHQNSGDDIHNNDTYRELSTPKVSTLDHNNDVVVPGAVAAAEWEEHSSPERRNQEKKWCPLSSLFLFKGKGGKANKNKVKDQVFPKENMLKNSGKAFDKDHELDIMVESGSAQGSGHNLERSSNRHRVQQLVRRTWSWKVKLVLAVDIVFCIILFVIWLVICKGFHCVG